MQRISDWLLAKPIHAGLVALVCTLLPLLGLPGDFLACIVVAFVTLRQGPKGGLFVLAWVALPAIALLFLHDVGVFDVLLVRAIIIWLAACVLHRSASWSHVLYALTLVGIIAVIAFHMVVGDTIGFWSGRISAYLTTFSKDANLSLHDIQSHAKTLSHFATGVMTMVIELGIFLQLLFARFWQAWKFNPGGLRQEALNIRVSQIYSGVMLIACIAAFMHVAIVIDFMPVLLLPFLVAGFSLLHMCVEQKRVWMLVLILVYVAAFLVPYVAGVIALLGFIDSWWSIRKRYQLSVRN